MTGYISTIKSGLLVWSKCVPNVAAKYPPAENPITPILFLLSFHSFAFRWMICIAVFCILQRHFGMTKGNPVIKHKGRNANIIKPSGNFQPLPLGLCQSTISTSRTNKYRSSVIRFFGSKICVHSCFTYESDNSTPWAVSFPGLKLPSVEPLGYNKIFSCESMSTENMINKITTLYFIVKLLII